MTIRNCKTNRITQHQHIFSFSLEVVVNYGILCEVLLHAEFCVHMYVTFKKKKKKKDWTKYTHIHTYILRYVYIYRKNI